MLASALQSRFQGPAPHAPVLWCTTEQQQRCRRVQASHSAAYQQIDLAANLILMHAVLLALIGKPITAIAQVARELVANSGRSHA